MRGAALLDRWSAASAQAAVAGTYAWAVTVVPSASAPGAPMVAKVAAGAGLAALALGTAGESRWGQRARFGSLWTFVLSSAITWSTSPSPLGPRRLDIFGSLSGMLGWGLFALASAGPALGLLRATERIVVEEPLEARQRLPRGDTAYILGGLLLAAAFQVVGWREANAERALLVRLVALATGLAVIGAAAEIAFGRQAPPARSPWASRLRQATPALTVLGMLLLVGILLSMSR